MPARRLCRPSWLLILCAVASPVRAQTLPAAVPAAVGVSAERLNRLSSTMQHAVDAGQAAGIVTIVVRHGKVVELEAPAAAQSLDLSAFTKSSSDHLPIPVSSSIVRSRE